MNGEERDRLIKLETTFKERWDHHDKRSNEMWGELRDQIRSIFSKLDNLRCDTHHEKFNALETIVAKAAGEKLNSRKASQWRIGLIVGVVTGFPATLLVILKLIAFWGSR